MFRQLMMSLLFIIGLMNSKAYAAPTPQPMTLGLGLGYVLKVNEPQIITNQFMFWLKATCAITSNNESNLLAITVLRKSGAFNGTKLLTGDSISAVVYGQDNIEILAAPGAQVELVNQGTDTIYADCSVT